MTNINPLRCPAISLSTVISALFFIASSGMPIITEAQEGVMVTGAEPVVPRMGVKLKSVTIAGFTQPLDGVDCEECTFKNLVLTYSGGSFRLVKPRFENVSIELKGAAKNTVALLDFIRVITSPPPPKQLPDPKANPMVPIKNILTTVDLISPVMNK